VEKKIKLAAEIAEEEIPAREVRLVEVELDRDVRLDRQGAVGLTRDPLEIASEVTAEVAEEVESPMVAGGARGLGKGGAQKAAC
jgi:hypothetical protein